MLAVRPIPLFIASIVALFGCTRAPEGPPIVLRKPSPAPHVVKRTGPTKTTTAATELDDTVPLSPSEKEALFRAFDTHLNQMGPQK